MRESSPLIPHAEARPATLTPEATQPTKPPRFVAGEVALRAAARRVANPRLPSSQPKLKVAARRA